MNEFFIAGREIVVAIEGVGILVDFEISVNSGLLKPHCSDDYFRAPRDIKVAVRAKFCFL